MIQEYAAHLLIGGETVRDTTAGRFEVLNPATEQVLGTAPLAGAAEVSAAIDAAQRALAQWRQSSPLQRAAVVRGIAALIRERSERLAILLTLEVGKPIGESRIEVAAAAEYFDWCAEEARRSAGTLREGRTPGTRLEVSHEPVGIVLALTAWNYPIILAARKLSMAIAAGCSVIVRPADEAPGCVAALAACCQDAGLPQGTINLLFGSPEAVVEPLMDSKLIRKISFTGSTRVGQILMRRSADTVKRMTMELGGHAPFIVLEDADVDVAAHAAAAGKFRNAGQVCTAPSRFFVHEAAAAAFTRRMSEIARHIHVGDGMNPASQMGPLATPSQRDRTERFVADARLKGARIECGGGRPGSQRQGYFFEPTVLADVPADADILVNEPFAPIAAIVPVASAQEAVSRANSLEYGLAAYLFGKSAAMIEEVTEQLEAGVIGVNNVAVALAEAPFGGVKQSGFGREGGESCLREFQNVKFVHRMI